MSSRRFPEVRKLPSANASCQLHGHRSDERGSAAGGALGSLAIVVRSGAFAGRAGLSDSAALGTSANRPKPAPQVPQSRLEQDVLERFLAKEAEGEGFEPSTRLNDV